jgi:hypothetical protein
VKKLNQAANQKLHRTGGSPFQTVGDHMAARTSTNLLQYNSFDAPEQTTSVKRVINTINDSKRVGYQKHKFSSFDNTTSTR